MKEPNWWERFRAWLAHKIFPEPNTWYVEACESAEKLEKETAALKRGIGFFASVIKSGEKWTQYCQDMYDTLLTDTQESE